MDSIGDRHLDRMFCMVSRQDRFQHKISSLSNVFSLGERACSHNLREDVPPCWEMWNTNMATQISREKCGVVRISSIYSFSEVIDSFRVELKLQLIEAKGKAHNKPINTLSGLVHAGEFMNYRSRGYRLNSMILSLLVRCLFIGRGKHSHKIITSTVLG